MAVSAVRLVRFAAAPEDVAAKVRAAGGVPGQQAVGDIAGAMRYLRALPYVSDKVGVFGTCSGGRHAYLAGCRVESFHASMEHALNIDFVNEGLGVGARVAVELSADAARALAATILAVLEEARVGGYLD
jgi:hypothetical protein